MRVKFIFSSYWHFIELRLAIFALVKWVRFGWGMDAIRSSVLVFGCQNNYVINTDSGQTDSQSARVAVSSNYSFTRTPPHQHPPRISLVNTCKIKGDH